MIKPNVEEEEKVRGGEKLALVLYTKSPQLRKLQQ
jgi:hypothetical protein